jgi:hypothetical protein
MRVHLYALEVSRARPVGVLSWNLELNDDLVLHALGDEFGDGSWHVDDGRQRRALSTTATHQESAEAAKENPTFHRM